jgi:hypothetical protein
VATCSEAVLSVVSVLGDVVTGHVQRGLVAYANLRPRERPLSIAMMYFRDILEKAPDAFPPREIIRFAAERLSELEVGTVTSVA